MKRLAIIALLACACVGQTTTLHNRYGDFTYSAADYRVEKLLVGLPLPAALRHYMEPMFFGQEVYVNTAGGTFTVPSGWNSASNTVQFVADGGKATGTGTYTSGGGGGGSYVDASNIVLTGGGSAYITFQAGGSSLANALCTSSTNCTSGTGASILVRAYSGAGATNTQTGAAGGACTNALPVGATCYAGGAGGNGYSSAADGSGGGGGAGGPGAAGSAGSTGTASAGGAGGQGNGTSGGTGGSGATSSVVATAGFAGTDIYSTYGTGGGGGGAFAGITPYSIGAVGGSYGGGAGGGESGSHNGGPGLMVATYTPTGSSGAGRGPIFIGLLLFLCLLGV